MASYSHRSQSCPPQHLQSRTAAAQTVTSDDDLSGSIEGCIILLAECENISGNLRRSWLAIRRAIALAQMGLHRCIKGSPLANGIKFVDKNTRYRVDVEYIWFRLVFSDRYLSLMLNLPPATTGGNFATPEALAACIPIERLQRLLDRENSTDLVATAHEVDRVLQEAATCMPAGPMIYRTRRGSG